MSQKDLKLFEAVDNQSQLKSPTNNNSLKLIVDNCCCNRTRESEIAEGGL